MRQIFALRPSESLPNSAGRAEFLLRIRSIISLGIR
jgi:hypothetical protein